MSGLQKLNAASAQSASAAKTLTLPVLQANQDPFSTFACTVYIYICLNHSYTIISILNAGELPNSSRDIYFLNQVCCLPSLKPWGKNLERQKKQRTARSSNFNVLLFFLPFYPKEKQVSLVLAFRRSYRR